MQDLNKLYEQAVSQIKNKVIADITRYMEWQDELPSVDQYRHDRVDFLNQSWLNIWTNKIQSAFSLKEKIQYLLDKGVEFETQNKKVVKRLFLDSMKDAVQFDVDGWIVDHISSEQWKIMYNDVKERLAKQSIEIEREQRRATGKQMVQDSFRDIVNKLFHEIYTYVRFRVSCQLRIDLHEKLKYKVIGRNWENEQLVRDGRFNEEDYHKVAQFFNEYTGDYDQFFDWGRLYYDFQTYESLYHGLVEEFVYDALFEPFQQVITSLFRDYEELTGQRLKRRNLIEIVSSQIEKLKDDYFDMICEEYTADLLEVSTIPYDKSQHMALLEKHQVLQEQRRIQEEMERKRKIEEEKRIIADVFEREVFAKDVVSIHYYLHIGETNTGKTFQALQRLKQAESGCYLAPLRLLALEVFDKLNDEGVPCSLKTGEEEKLLPEARHISSTVEMFSEREKYDCVVIDEAQMIADKERGFSWYRAITGATAKEVHIIGSRNSQNMLLQLLEGSDITIYEYFRDTPLEVEKKLFKIEEAKKGDALICFSRRKVLETASFLQSKGKKVSMIYGSMPPETRKKQMQQFLNGQTSTIVSTDAIGMGLNLPIQRIVFLENEKFDGTKRRRLTSQELKQIAGRAGRKGIYEIGKVAFTTDVKRMRALLEKDDPSLQTFTIAPTNSMLERFQKYSHNLGTFFELWKKFNNPKGTMKATLTQEIELFQLIKETEIEGRLSMMDLYGFLHLPFSSSEKVLTQQWLETMWAIIKNEPIPQPVIKRGSLDEIELTYKAIGLHLLFLYKLGRKTETYYWERLRKEISDEANDLLRKAVKSYKKVCKRCGRKLPYSHPYQICDHCYARKFSYDYM